MTEQSPIIGYVQEIEQEVLGCLLFGADYRKVMSFLRDDHFVPDLHRIIYRAIQQSFERLGSTAMPTVMKLLPEGFSEACMAKLGVSASTYLASLNGYNVTGNVERAATAVVEQWGRLKSAEIAASFQAAANDPAADPRKLIQSVSSDLDLIASEMRRGPRRKTRMSIASAAGNAFSAAREARQRGSGLTGITWGLADVNRHTGGIQRRDLTLIGARPSMGKAQPLTAKVRTPRGWTVMGNLRVGDQVSSVDGASSVVTGVFPQGEKQVYRITFSDGRSTRCCGDHLWRVYYRNWDDPRVLSTDELVQKLSKARYQGRLWIDMPVASGDVNSALPIDPWVLGALLGDGGLSGGGVRFSSACAESVERMANRLPEDCRIDHVAAYDYAITMKDRLRNSRGHPAPNTVKEALTSLGLLGLTSDEKFIPERYLEAGPEQRLNVLRGLLDTDGWVERHGTVCLCTVSKKLAEGVCEIARSLGAWCSIKPRQKFYTYKGERKAGKPAFVCVISHADPSSLFLMTAKVEKAKARTRRKLPTIVSIDPDGFEQAQCISVSHPSKLYVTDDYIVTHNTTLGLSTAIKAAKSGAGVGFVSLEMDADKLAARAISDIAYDWGVKVPYSDIIKGNVSDADLDSLTSGSSDLDRLSIWIEEQSGLSMTDIRVKAEAMMEDMQRQGASLDLLLIDHLGLIRPGGRYSGNRVQEISEMTAGCKALAREYGIAVVLLSQLNRAVESRDNKVPQLSDLRDSGSIEQDADTIIFLYREAYYLQREKGGGHEKERERAERLADCEYKLEFHIAKQRNGPLRSIDLFVDVACSAVRNGAHQ